MLKLKHMQKQKNSKRTFLLGLIFVPIVAILAIVVILTTILSKNAELILLVAPSTATLKIDGHKVASGSIKLRAGSHTLVISGEGFEEKQIDFEIAKHETKSINAYAGNDNDFEYYLKHDTEIDRLALVADEEAIKFINNYRKSKTILELLPIVVAKEYGAKSSTLSRGDTCERSYCLKITDDNADLRKEMEAKIVELGYNPENYEIIYERTDSIEEDNEN